MPTEPFPSNDPGTLLWLCGFLRRRAADIALATLAVLLATVLALHVAPTHYLARADVLLDPRRDKAFGPDDVASTASLDTASVAALCRKRTNKHAIQCGTSLNIMTN
ncbi:hypothetical protein P7D22_20350 [Lichenihabitans sp. Uapishka_5]|uniref:hypothetical protein n=1 Tax=Lichenihabitans sp. Uapishka_5 TaxID=3037302 RepID=UPI0029E7E012|nr:hypothetical protein [Lichenihabitans sp. Uapishka_5]MDX7953520.1 hypothetical protein [Lichenihabitans sp. Uapishka_5]